MGIYDNWDEFVKMAEEMGGTASVDLPLEGTKWDSFVCWLDFAWHLGQFLVILAFLAFDTILWMDIIDFLRKA